MKLLKITEKYFFFGKGPIRYKTDHKGDSHRQKNCPIKVYRWNKKGDEKIGDPTFIQEFPNLESAELYFAEI